MYFLQEQLEWIFNLLAVNVKIALQLFLNNALYKTNDLFLV